MWVRIKKSDGSEKLVCLTDIDVIFVEQEEGEDTENDPFYVFGNIGTSPIVIYVGTQVECMRVYDKLSEMLKPVDLEAWN